VQRDYQELLAEIKEITTADGFVSSCLEIKESLYFYELDLMLAAYTASLELLAAAALLHATLKSRADLLKARAAVEHYVENLLADLNKFRFPLDVQYVVDRFLQGPAPRIRWRLAVYGEMMQAYAALEAAPSEGLDELLRRAHRLLRGREAELGPKLTAVLGQVGARMLRGARLRPIWLQVSHPRIQIALSGLQTLMNNLRVTPYFNYPLEDLATERQKRRKVKGNVVADLGVFRNFRQGGSGYTELNIPLERDEYDNFLEGFSTGFQYLDVEPDEVVVDLITMILEARLVHGGVDSRFLLRLLVYCNRWKLSQVSDTILELLEELDWDDPLFYESWSLLKSFAGKALPAMRRFVRKHRDSPLLPYLALFLSSGPPSKRRWSLLKEIFEHYPEENEDKVHIALSIARYGGEDAVAFLEQVLTSAKSSNGAYRRELEKALAAAKQEAGH
jgi:hypothetical protein